MGKIFSLFFIFLSSNMNAQNITAEKMLQLFNQNFSEFENYSLENGYKKKNDKLSDDKDFDILTFQKEGEILMKAVIKPKIDVAGLNSKLIQLDTNNEKEYLRIKSEAEKLGFIYQSTENTQNRFVHKYLNGKLEFSFHTINSDSYYPFSILISKVIR